MLDLASESDFPTVLLIDDDLVSREVTATLLTMTGYTVHTAETGEAALGIVAAGICRPGVLLVDAQMPGLSGVKLIAGLREACCGACIYIVSGSEPGAALAAVADGFLQKPFQAEALRKLIEGYEKTLPSQLDPNDPVISAVVLGQLRQHMPDAAVREIYVALVEDLHCRIEALRGAVSKRDAAEVRRIGHTIKGGCGMAGAMQAAHLGALLETGDFEPQVNDFDDHSDNHFDNIRALLRDLRAAVRELQRILDLELPV